MGLGRLSPGLLQKRGHPKLATNSKLLQNKVQCIVYPTGCPLPRKIDFVTLIQNQNTERISLGEGKRLLYKIRKKIIELPNKLKFQKNSENLAWANRIQILIMYSHKLGGGKRGTQMDTERRTERGKVQ
jgi:hypothetical protein